MFRPEQYNQLTIFHSSMFYQQPGIVHGFSSRVNGCSKTPYQGLNLGLTTGDSIADVQQNRKMFSEALGILPEQIVSGYQVHGTRIAHVTAQDCGKGVFDAATALPDIDGLITATPNVALMTLYADCVPILFYDVRQNVIAVCHCGWRGTVNGLAAKMVSVMTQEYGCSPEHICAAIGPSISQAHYEVDEVVLNQFKQTFDYADQLIVPTDDHHGKVDLWKANQLQLEAAGLLPMHIEVSGFCTYQHVELFYSHRAEHGITGRNAALLMLKNK